MNLFQKYLAEEFVEDYQEGRISRRQALKLIASVTGSLLMAQGMLAACTPNTEEATEAPASPSAPAATATEGAATQVEAEPATAEATPTTAAASETPAATTGAVAATEAPGGAGPVEFPGADGATLTGYLAQPAGNGPFAVVLVCHENRGLTEYIQDVTRRLAQAGYIGLAVDLLSREGGTAALGADNVPGVLGNLPPDQFVADFRSGWQHLQTLAGADAARVGMVGFCFGGGVTWRVATQMPELWAAVPFYGPHPPVEDVPNIQAPVLAIYAEQDQRINQGIPAIEAAMQANGKVYQKVIYPGVDHAFHNDTGSRYNAEAAQDAWARTLEWFATYLS